MQISRIKPMENVVIKTRYYSEDCVKILMICLIFKTVFMSIKQTKFVILAKKDIIKQTEFVVHKTTT